jgi:hypothetical protein
MSSPPNPANTSPESDQPQEPTLLIDDKAYAYGALSDRAKVLSNDFVRTHQEWTDLQHRYRQFLAMETTVVNQLKDEVDRAGLRPHEPVTSGDLVQQALLTIDATAYAIEQIPDQARLYVNDLLRTHQERGQLEFRLRQLDAARAAYQGALRDELAASGAVSLATSTATATTTSGANG